MRRRCCCTPLPGNCWTVWDRDNCGAGNRPGAVVTFTWAGGQIIPSPLAGTLPGADMVPTFTPTLASGSMELQYAGTYGNGLSQGCVWYGKVPISMAFPEITLPNDYAENGSGSWPSFTCPGYTITKQFAPIELAISARFVISFSSQPYFNVDVGMRSVYDRYYEPIIGTYKWPSPRYLATDAVDLADCTQADCDPTVRPDFYQLVRFQGDPPVEAFDFAGGRGFNYPGVGFLPYGIPASDIDCANRRMKVVAGFDATISRRLCIPVQFTNCQTECRGVSFGFKMATIEGTLRW